MITAAIITPNQTSFSIHTNCSALLKTLRLRYGCYLQPEYLLPQYALNNVINVTKAGGDYRITYQGDTFHTNYPLKAIDDIMYLNREYDRHVLALHGAAVAYHNKAYIFLAATETGKTTLTGYLTANNFAYLTDDCVLLDRDSFHIQPFHTPLQLRPGGYDILKGICSLSGSIAFWEDLSQLRYSYTPTNVAVLPLPLAHIFFLHRTDDTNLVENMCSTERMTHLMMSPIKEYPLTGEYLHFLSKLAKVPCHRLHFCDMRFVMEVIKNES